MSRSCFNGTGSIPASKKFDLAGWSKDVDLFEVNEAFAAQSIAVLRTLSIQMKINVNGEQLL